MEAGWLLVAIFLPLFPFSALFVRLLGRISNAWTRALLFLVWPQVGLLLLFSIDSQPPEWILIWATVTAVLYALRTLAIHDAGLWLTYIAVSCWSLLWLVMTGVAWHVPELVVLGMSLPLAIMTLLLREVEARYRAVYSGLYGGIVQTQPRLSVLLVIGMLSITATPLFPGFFTLFFTVLDFLSSSPWLAPGLLLVWWFWSWSAMRLLQGMIMGPVNVEMRHPPDMHWSALTLYSMGFLSMVWLGFYLSGGVG